MVSSVISLYTLDQACLDELGFKIILDTEAAAFTPHTAFLDAAERRFCRSDGDFVDSHHADFKRLGRQSSSPQVFGEDITRQSERRRIGAFDHFFERLEARDR